MAAALDDLLTRERIRRCSAVLLVAHLAVGVVAILLGAWPKSAFGVPVLPDLVARIAGAELVLSGRAASLYDVAAQRAVEAAIVQDPTYLNLYLSPPFVALLYAPFARIPYAAAAIAWTGLSVALLAVAARLARPLLPRLSGDAWGTALLAAAATQPVIEALGSGQDTALSLLLWVGVSGSRWPGATCGQASSSGSACSSRSCSSCRRSCSWRCAALVPSSRGRRPPPASPRYRLPWSAGPAGRRGSRCSDRLSI